MTGNGLWRNKPSSCSRMLTRASATRSSIASVALRTDVFLSEVLDSHDHHYAKVSGMVHLLR